MSGAPEASVTATAPPGGSATASSPPPVTTLKTVEHDKASDLPEISWLWRRVFIFLVSAALLLLIWRLSERATDIATLRMVLRYALGLLGVTELLYVAGASAESLTRLVGAVRTTRRETLTSHPADVPPAP